MASSRKSANQANQAAAGKAANDSVAAAVTAAIAAVAAIGSVEAIGALGGDAAGPTLAVAFSGGLDSTVLLDACCAVAGPARVVALHVHHGLQPAADDWPALCQARAHALGCRFRLLRARGAPARGDSIEAWARDERYRLLLDAAREEGGALLLTAHHADDQLETMLLALARGSGLDGLTGIAAHDRRDGITVLRPLLGLSRDQLLDEARARNLQWIDDPSNASMRHLRNAVRERVVPVLESALPGIRQRATQAAALLAQAREALDSLAAADLDAVTLAAGPLHELDRGRLAGLAPARRAGALRAWLVRMGEQPPSRAKLAAIEDQLVEGDGACAEVRHGRIALMRYRDRIVGWLRPTKGRPWPDACSLGDAKSGPPAVVIRWQGESRIELPGFGGVLNVESVKSLEGAEGEEGAETLQNAPSAQWLRSMTLHVEAGRGGARLRPHLRGPSRTLKNLYQELGVPASMRAWFPTVRIDHRLLYAAPFGMDRSGDWPSATDGVRLRWETDAAGDPRRLFEPLPKV
jgi:tRNA(Ile)-lysidine synthase